MKLILVARKALDGVLDDLCTLEVGHVNRRLDKVEGAIQLAKQGLCAFGFRADDYTVRAHEIADGGTLAQELGIGGHVEIGVRDWFC